MASPHKYFNPKAMASPHKYFNHHHAKHYLFLLYMLSHDDIKNFVVQNNVLGYAIAMIIALTLKDFVAAFIGNFIVPAINLFLIQLQIKSLTKFLPGNEVIDLSPIIKSLLTFVLTFLLVFLSITLFFSSWVIPKRQLPSRDGDKEEEMMMM